MATLKQIRIAKLEEAGLQYFEAAKLADSYTLKQIRSLPYLQNLLRSRRLYRANALKAKMTLTDYKVAIKKLYIKKGWLVNGKSDFWTMLRSYRKEAIVSGDYTPPSRKKVSHHKIRQSDLDGQSRRISSKERELEKEKAHYRNRIFVINLNIKNKEATPEELKERDRLQKWLKEH